LPHSHYPFQSATLIWFNSVPLYAKKEGQNT
jgi:hypothetical protein